MKEILNQVEQKEIPKDYQMRWMIDIDGCISANPNFFAMLTYLLGKETWDNGCYSKNRITPHEIHIVTSRPEFVKELTIEQLDKWNISYDHLVLLDSKSGQSAGQAKAEYARDHDINIWIDNDFHSFEEVWDICPNTKMIWV